MTDARRRDYDVLVVGGGLSGFAAGLTCARAGLDTLVAGAHPVPGWEGVWTFQNELPPEPAGLAKEVSEAVAAKGGRGNGVLDNAVLELTLDAMATEAGLDLLYHVRPVALLTAGGAACGAVLAGKSGESEVGARVVVDATYGAALWRCAGSGVGEPGGSWRYGFMMNHALGLTEPVELSGPEGYARLRVVPSVWPGEARILFDAEVSRTVDAQEMVPDVLRAVRDEAPACAEGLVTQMAYEAVPLEAPTVEDMDGFAHAEMEGLFGAGPWAGDVDLVGNAFADLLAIGEEAGRQAAAEQPAPGGEAERLDAPVQQLEANVIVCGGGTAGTVAALAAAREGADTLLIESTPILGGIGTGGNIHGYFFGVEGGLQDALDERTDELTPLMAPAGRVRQFHPVAKWLATLQMLREVGVRVMVNTTVYQVDTRDASGGDSKYALSRIEDIRTVGPGGPISCRAPQFIDSTGDADVAAMAGAPFRYGREGDGLLHPYTLSGSVLDDEGHLRHLNFDAGYCDSDDVFDVTRARRDALQHYRRERYDAENRVLFIAPILGIRQGRQIEGEYTLTLGDETLEREFDDVIAYAMSNFDNHARDYASESDEAVIYCYLLDQPRGNYGSEVPFRCLLPRRVENLLVACRGVSLTQNAHYQMRMMRDMQRIGEAAGVAAALCSILDRDPRELPTREVQERLFSTGALGPPDADRSPGEEVVLHWSGAFPEAPQQKPAGELADDLAGDDPQTAAWMLVQEGERAMPELLDAVRSENAEVRFWASIPLAMLRSREAVPPLLHALEERRTGDAEGVRNAPDWVGAAVLLGRLGDERAVPALVSVLEEKDAPTDGYVAALRSLGRIADRSAADAVRRFLERDDIDTRQKLAGGPWQGPVFADIRWRVDLAAAEALARMGENVADIVGPYLEHKDRPVRRRARAVLDIAAGNKK